MTATVAAMAARPGGMTPRLTAARYLIASICALCADTGLFLGLVALGLGNGLAAFLGYAAGLGLHWLLSVHFVFALERRPTYGQRVHFILSGLMGLAITVGVVSLLGAWGVSAAPSKAAAVIVSFFTVYMVRKYVVFGRA